MFSVEGFFERSVGVYGLEENWINFLHSVHIPGASCFTHRVQDLTHWLCPWMRELTILSLGFCTHKMGTIINCFDIITFHFDLHEAFVPFTPKQCVRSPVTSCWPMPFVTYLPDFFLDLSVALKAVCYTIKK